MGRQYEGIPSLSLAFCGHLRHAASHPWLPFALVLMTTILMVETELEVGFERFEVRRRLPCEAQVKSGA